MKQKPHEKNTPLRRILAALGAFLLFGLYGATLFSAFADDTHYESLLTASVYATFVIPVLLWAFTLLGRLVGKSNPKNEGDT